jgi:hypothetical protein
VPWSFLSSRDRARARRPAGRRLTTYSKFDEVRKQKSSIVFLLLSTASKQSNHAQTKFDDEVAKNEERKKLRVLPVCH